MTRQAGHAVESLRTAIQNFAMSHPDSLRRFGHGQRVINQGAVSDECFLIKEGNASILVRDPTSGTETQVALRFEGDLIGETAFLQRNAPRTASVQIVSQDATLIRLARNDIFGILRENPALHDAITLLWELAASRHDETLQVLKGHITVENSLMSVILSDIHNFTTLGEAAWEEQSNCFLFDFVEQSHEASVSYKGSFEDQGDGFKITFGDSGHAGRALACATTIKDAFVRLRTAWLERNDAFGSIGLGIGICSDCMSIRKREGSPHSEGRVLSHAINVAASISKYRAAPSDVDIYIDENTFSMVGATEYDIVGPQQKWLEKLGRLYPVYCVRGSKAKNTSQKRAFENDKGYMNSSNANAGQEDDRRSVSILFLASDPTDATRLRLATEAREIQEKLQISKYRDRFSFHQRGAVRPEDLSQALLDVEPNVVHISGHGTASGELCFEDKTGKTHALSAGSLAALFCEFSRTVSCVILNACFSEKQADAIAKHVDYVIGMDKAISDKAAIAFAVGLYQAIGAGKTVDEAYRLGCVQIGLQSIGNEENLTPVLKARTDGKA